MPVTPSKRVSISSSTTPLLLLLAVLFAFLPAYADGEPSPDNDFDLDELLHTETVLIDTLRHYIKTLEMKISTIKRKTLEIKAIHDVAITDMDKYLNNPLNSVTIIKRFTADWSVLRRYARDNNSTKDILENLSKAKESLKFPSETDFDEAAGNLLRIQGIYNLQSERLAVGEVNGIKLGAEMSWSDCLEIGRVSEQNGDFTLAKFWMETALGKLPAEANATIEHMPMPRTMTTTTKMTTHESEKARFEIWDAMMSTEYQMGNLEEALHIANKLLELQPNHKSLTKSKAILEKEIQERSGLKKKSAKKNDKKLKKKHSKKSVEESLIEEICRSQSTTSLSHCSRVTANLPQLLLQPLNVEYLSHEPFIAVYHNVLQHKELNDLPNYIDDTYDIDADDAAPSPKFTPIGQKKLQKITKRLQEITGHASGAFDNWQLDRWTYEDDIEAETLLPQSNKNVANVYFNVQTSKLGGAVVFPQLEFSVQVPPRALLYWTNLNEFHEFDYRTRQHVCPIIAGTQIAAFTTIKSA